MKTEKKLRRLQKTEMLHAQTRLAEIRTALDAAYSCFDMSADPELTDACIYEISALRSRYNSAIRQIKSIGN